MDDNTGTKNNDIEDDMFDFIDEDESHKTDTNEKTEHKHENNVEINAPHIKEDVHLDNHNHIETHTQSNNAVINTIEDTKFTNTAADSSPNGHTNDNVKTDKASELNGLEFIEEQRLPIQNEAKVKEETNTDLQHKNEHDDIIKRTDGKIELGLISQNTPADNKHSLIEESKSEIVGDRVYKKTSEGLEDQGDTNNIDDISENKNNALEEGNSEKLGSQNVNEDVLGDLEFDEVDEDKDENESIKEDNFVEKDIKFSQKDDISNQTEYNNSNHKGSSIDYKHDENNDIHNVKLEEDKKQDIDMDNVKKNPTEDDVFDFIDEDEEKAPPQGHHEQKDNDKIPDVNPHEEIQKDSSNNELGDHPELAKKDNNFDDQNLEFDEEREQDNEQDSPPRDNNKSLAFTSSPEDSPKHSIRKDPEPEKITGQAEALEDDQFDFIDEDDNTEVVSASNTVTQPHYSDSKETGKDEKLSTENITSNNDANHKVETAKINTVEDDEVFEFVDEEEPDSGDIENKMVEKPAIPSNNEDSDKVNKNIDEEDDFFDFVDEEIDCTSTNNKAKEPTEIHRVSKNLDLIKSLTSEYKEKYIDTKLYEDQTSADEEIKVGVEFITDFHLDVEKNNTSISSFIENLNNFNSIPEVGIKTLGVEDILSLARVQNQNISTSSLSYNRFSNLLSEVPKTTIQNLYFKLIDIKNIYLSSIHPSSYNQKQGIELESSNPNEEAQGGITDRDKKDTGSNYSASPEKAASGLVDNRVGVSAAIGRSSSKAIPVEKPTAGAAHDDEDFDFRDDNVDDKDYNRTASTQIQIDSDLYSIVLGGNSIQQTQSEKQENRTSKEDNTPSVLDENKMLELLRHVGVKNEGKPSDATIHKDVKQEEFNKLIADLPNYKFMISRFVEYPDSLFNI